MTCTTAGCTRRPRPEFVICDTCVAAILRAEAPRREPEWVQRAKAHRLPIKDWSAA
jgi:hypothetical protein